MNESKNENSSSDLLLKMSEVETEEVNFLYYPYIPKGKISIVQGNPGDGKTHLLIKVAADCTRGRPLPGSTNNETINVIYLTAEDGLGDTIRPRLEEAGADLDKIYTIKDDNRPLTLKDKRIEQAIKQTEAKLVIIDPIQAFIGGSIDMNRANEVRQILKPLVVLAQKYDCAIVLIGHLNKAQGLSSIYRGIGSMDFSAIARSILLVGRDKEDPSVRVLVHDKSSLAPEGPSIGFRLDGPDGFEWLEGYDNVTAEDILSSPRQGKNRTNGKLDQAVKLLEELFKENESIFANEVIETAKSRNIGERTLKEAKKRVGWLESIKKNNAWVWQVNNEARK